MRGRARLRGYDDTEAVTSGEWLVAREEKGVHHREHGEHRGGGIPRCARNDVGREERCLPLRRVWSPRRNDVADMGRSMLRPYGNRESPIAESNGSFDTKSRQDAGATGRCRRE
jgi:hypothetical protein